MSVKDFPPIRVLLVEDEFLIGELVADYLAEQGFAVRYVANGVDALRHLAAEPVDVLFTDIDLPGGIDGTTLARSARERFPGLPVVYASGRARVLETAMRVPGSIFVAKPYLPAAVGRLLARVVRAAAELPAA